MIHPIIDDFYNHNPSYIRSSSFAVSEGLVSNVPGTTQSLTPLLSSGEVSETEALHEGKHDAIKIRLEAVERRVTEVGLDR